MLSQHPSIFLKLAKHFIFMSLYHRIKSPVWVIDSQGLVNAYSPPFERLECHMRPAATAVVSVNLANGHSPLFISGWCVVCVMRLHQKAQVSSATLASWFERKQIKAWFHWFFCILRASLFVTSSTICYGLQNECGTQMFLLVEENSNPTARNRLHSHLYSGLPD